MIRSNMWSPRDNARACEALCGGGGVAVHQHRQQRTTGRRLGTFFELMHAPARISAAEAVSQSTSTEWRASGHDNTMTTLGVHAPARISAADAVSPSTSTVGGAPLSAGPVAVTTVRAASRPSSFTTMVAPSAGGAVEECMGAHSLTCGRHHRARCNAALFVQHDRGPLRGNSDAVVLAAITPHPEQAV